MQAYEPGELKSLQRQQLAQEQMDEQVLSVSLGPINSGVKFEDDSEDGEAYLDEQMADYAELEYFCQASQAVAAQANQGKGANNLVNKKAVGKPTPSDDFIGIDNAEE